MKIELNLPDIDNADVVALQFGYDAATTDLTPSEFMTNTVVQYLWAHAAELIREVAARKARAEAAIPEGLLVVKTTP